MGIVDQVLSSALFCCSYDSRCSRSVGPRGGRWSWISGLAVIRAYAKTSNWTFDAAPRRAYEVHRGATTGRGGSQSSGHKEIPLWMGIASQVTGCVADWTMRCCERCYLRCIFVTVIVDLDGKGRDIADDKYRCPYNRTVFHRLSSRRWSGSYRGTMPQRNQQ